MAPALFTTPPGVFARRFLSSAAAMASTVAAADRSRRGVPRRCGRATPQLPRSVLSPMRVYSPPGTAGPIGDQARRPAPIGNDPFRDRPPDP